MAYMFIVWLYLFKKNILHCTKTRKNESEIRQWKLLIPLQRNSIAAISKTSSLVIVEINPKSISPFDEISFKKAQNRLKRR